MFYIEAQLNFDILDCTYMLQKAMKRAFSGLDYYIDTTEEKTADWVNPDPA